MKELDEKKKLQQLVEAMKKLIEPKVEGATAGYGKGTAQTGTKATGSPSVGTPR